MKTLRIAVDLEDDHVQLKQTNYNSFKYGLNLMLWRKSHYLKTNIDKYEDKICCWQLNSKYFMFIQDNMKQRIKLPTN